MSYLERLHNHNWYWHLSCLDRAEQDKHAWNEVDLIREAREDGHQALFNHFYVEAFGIPFFKDFPIATLAKEQPKNNKHMNIQVTLTADESLLEALNGIKDALTSKTAPQAAPAPETEEEAPVPAPGKKAAGKKTKAAPAPEPEPEEEEEKVPSGAELADMYRGNGLTGTTYAAELREYMEEKLGVKTRLSEVTDPGVLKKLHTKLLALIEKKKAADSDDI